YARSRCCGCLGPTLHRRWSRGRSDPASVVALSSRRVAGHHLLRRVGQGTLWSGCPYCSTHLLATPIRTGSGRRVRWNPPVMAGQFWICGAIQILLLTARTFDPRSGAASATCDTYTPRYDRILGQLGTRQLAPRVGSGAR